MLKHYTHNDPATLIDETRAQINALLEQARASGVIDAEIDLYGPQSRVLHPLSDAPVYYCPLDVCLSLDTIGTPEENRRELSRQLHALARVLHDPEQGCDLNSFDPATAWEHCLRLVAEVRPRCAEMLRGMR